MVTETKPRKHEPLSAYEQETIINFNKEDTLASIFTYEKSWQKHLEDKLGLKPVMDNGFGGKEYMVDKSRIFPPKAKRQYSDATKKKMSQRLSQLRKAPGTLSLVAKG